MGKHFIDPKRSFSNILTFFRATTQIAPCPFEVNPGRNTILSFAFTHRALCIAAFFIFFANWVQCQISGMSNGPG
jgi:hypothetical protein